MPTHYKTLKPLEKCGVCNYDMNYEQKCQYCNLRSCGLCIKPHKLTCDKKPPPTEEQLLNIEASKKIFENYEKAKTEVSENKNENCCQCGYKKDRKVMYHDIYFAPLYE